MIKIALVILATLALSACSKQNVDKNYGPILHTSTSALRYEITTSELEQLSKAPLYSCTTVEECWNQGNQPTLNNLPNGNQIYVWASKYHKEKVALYVVVNRPNQPSWDHLGFENLRGQWKIGIYGATELMMVGKVMTHKHIWSTQEIGENFPIALGLVDEDWAIIIAPENNTSFKFSIVSNYWE